MLISRDGAGGGDASQYFERQQPQDFSHFTVTQTDFHTHKQTFTFKPIIDRHLPSPSSTLKEESLQKSTNSINSKLAVHQNLLQNIPPQKFENIPSQKFENIPHKNVEEFYGCNNLV